MKGFVFKGRDIHNKIISCPSKLYILNEIYKSVKIEVKDLLERDLTFNQNTNKHIREMVENGVAHTNNSSLIITKQRNKIAREMESLRKEFRKLKD